jgi:nicotinate-nucleotide adenylyltransferase
LKLAIFGGTFDPIHRAHLAVAREAASKFSLDRVLFIPAAHPPHKAGVTHASYEDRVRMVELACEDDPRFQASRLEEGTGRSYSIDTIRKVRAGMAPGDELLFLIGADAFAELDTWRNWEEVARSVTFVVVSRPGREYRLFPGVRTERIDTLDLPVSSSEIRRALAAGEQPDDVPPEVLQYIREHRLYHNQKQIR